MKRFLILFIILMTGIAPLLAAEQDVPITIRTKGNGNNDERERAPLNVQINVVYDDESDTLTMTGATDTVGEVFIIDEFGDIVLYSSVVNCYFQLSNLDRGLYTIRILATNWSGEGAFIK